MDKIAKLMTRETCYDNIPIGDKFIHPQTRVLTNTAAKVPCKKFFPFLVETLEGWVVGCPLMGLRSNPKNSRGRGHGLSTNVLAL